MIIRPITISELPILTQLFDYNDPAEMIEQNERDIKNGTIDIFVMFDNDHPIGELHAAYESDDERAVKGKRAYLFAFRIHEDYQRRGYGKRLLQSVIDTLTEQGYYEFTVGVEDETVRKSFELVRKYNHNWSGFMKRFDESSFDHLKKYFSIEKKNKKDHYLHFTKEEWCGRMTASRGIGAALDDATIESFKEDMMDMLKKDSYDILHESVIIKLRKET